MNCVNRSLWREVDWLLPAVLLTAISSAFAIALIPDQSGMVPALLLLPMWMVAAAAMGAVIVLIGTVKIMVAGVEKPIAHWCQTLLENRQLLVFVTAGMLLAGLNMIAFMWIKPLLNYLVPFWADPYLATIDRQIFATDPWRFFGWLNNDFTAQLYHQAWFALMVLLLLKVLSSPPSQQKSATMLTYFLLWSVFGPAVHALMPAAGPVFYERLGYGAAFAAVPQPAELREVADYLWHLYSGSKFGPASGISAMPSLHIATTTWLVIATYLFARRWIWPVSAAALLILLLSISLGWHYAIDGIVGGLGAILIYQLTYRALSLQRSPTTVGPLANSVSSPHSANAP